MLNEMGELMIDDTPFFPSVPQITQIRLTFIYIYVYEADTKKLSVIH